MARRTSDDILSQPLLWTGLWLALVAVTLFSRPLMPVDETRYLSVAWDMWQRGDFLVPHINGEPYSHKPPLLFWLMHAGWAVTGVNEWWPRLVAPLFGLGCLFLTRSLARRLWPDRPEVALLAPVIVLGSLFWTLFSTLTFFDPLLAFFALLGIGGLITARQRAGWRGFIVTGVAIGLGVLAKGPAILVHVLPAALLAPLWAPRLIGPSGAAAPGPGWPRWYAGVLVSVLLGAAIGLAWAVPAAMSGGPEYANAIFWGQSAGRMVESFAHGRPWWWFAALLPVMLLPWPAWPGAWRAVAGGRFALSEGGVRLCLAWFVPALLVFSAISGKQPHYLLPEFPALALILGRLLADADPARATGRRALLLPGLIFAAIGIALAAAPVTFAGRIVAVHLLQPAWAVLLFLAIAAAVRLVRGGRLSAAVFALTLMSAAAVGAVHLAARPLLAEAFDQAPLARQLGDWQRAGSPLAHFGKYHAQFNFLGRLTAPVDIIDNMAEAAAWTTRNPTGRIISYESRRSASGPVLVLPFRGKWVEVWEAAVVARDPSVLHRN
ncbi:ArnT family glycosyltransferase [Shumkonia mesophila]|uniref:ArnT family glycosyltransferase n=1 Tax=Shumkonia mesophila TaxID=2838854 RepID=UPI0029342124|nr:glycosyltransferase family 39 protein [Shumkonia mesophila]